jgi:hypothetical protein
MPQVKESIIKKLIKKAIQEVDDGAMKKSAKGMAMYGKKARMKEAELTVGDDNTTFTIKVDVGNPQSETKLGIRIQLKPKSEDFLFTDKDRKGALSVAIMKKLNSALGQFDIQVSKDTDAETVDPTVLGFFIPLSQIKNMIVTSLGGKSEPAIGTPSPSKPPTPAPTPTPTPKTNNKPEPLDEQEDPLDRAARLAKEPLPAMSNMTGLGLKRSQYKQEEGGELPIEELYEKVTLVSELLVTIFRDINNSDYAFKEYLENNEDQYTRVGAVMAMIGGELEDRIEADEPVDEKGIEERLLKEMRVRDLNEASKIVIKEDFYGFINAGNNIIRTFEENGKSINEAKKYMKYLLAHNIM